MDDYVVYARLDVVVYVKATDYEDAKEEADRILDGIRLDSSKRTHEGKPQDIDPDGYEIVEVERHY